MTGPGDLRLTAAGIVAAATGAPVEEPAVFEVLFAERGLILHASGAAGRQLVDALRAGSRVEVRLVGEATGETGSLTAAGKASGWAR